MKRFAPLTLAAMATLTFGAHAAYFPPATEQATAAKPAQSAKAAECKKGYLGGIVIGTKMEGDTLVVSFRKSEDNIRIRKKDSAPQFDTLSKLKTGDTHCYPNEGS